MSVSKRSPLKWKFLRYSSALVKISQIPHVNFEMKSVSLQIFLSFFSVITCNSSISCSSCIFHFGEKNPMKYQFWHFQVFWWKFAKFLVSFSKPPVSFSFFSFLNFPWLFSVMKYNFSVLFWVKRCLLYRKGTNQSACFLYFLVLRSKFTKFLSLLKQKISLSSNFAPLFGMMRHNFFSWDIIYFQQK